MADIPVNANDALFVADITSNGQTLVDFDFLTYDDDDMRATHVAASTGFRTELEPGVDFTVSGVGQANGGTITLMAGAPVTVVDDQVIIYRESIIQRLFDYQKQGDFRADTINRELDTVYMILQEMRRDVDRSVKALLGNDPDTLVEDIFAAVEEVEADKAAAQVSETNAGLSAAAAALAAASLPAVAADTVIVGNSAGTARDNKTFDELVELLNLTYIKDYGSHTIPLRKFRTTYTDPANWSPVLQAAGDSGERTIRVQGDSEVTFADQWSISSNTQKWVGESMDNRSYLRRTTDVNEAAILVQAERCGMRNIGIKGVDYTSGGGVAKTAANAAILVARPAGEPVDLDFTFEHGYISEFYYCVSGFGRGITVADNLLTACRYATNFDWPAAGTYIKDRFVGDADGNGFRRQVFARNEVHSIAVAAVRNRGWNAANIKCVIEDNKSNFGKCMFAGYLGDGSVIRGNTIQNANFVGYELDGGTNWTMAKNSMVADRTVGGFPQPESFVKMTGTHDGFTIDGFRAGYCTSHGIDMRSGDFKGILRNVDLREVGTAGPASISGVIIIGTGANTEIISDGVTLRNAVAGQSVMRAHVAGCVLKHRGLLGIGAATPATSGPGTITAY